MKKSSVVLISLVISTILGAFVWYGVRHARGIPVVIDEPQALLLKVPHIDQEIDLTKGIAEGWESLAFKELELMYQVMVFPWPARGLTDLAVKAFHNGKDIYFYLEWKDDTEDRGVEINTFPDATAVMFSLTDDAPPSTLMMGFLGQANIWHWKANQDSKFWKIPYPEKTAYVDFYYPFEDEELFEVSKEQFPSAVNDLVAVRVGTITRKERQDVQGRGIWKDGTWHVVLKRSLKEVDPEIDAVFTSEKDRFCAFAVWNGAKGDRGGRKSISDRFKLQIGRPGGIL